MAHQERLNIAVFVDFDNIEIGVRTTLNQQFDIGAILEAIKERGEVVTKIAYADWTRAGEYSRALTQHAIRLVQRNLTPGGDKNGADINLALDALEMAFTHPHINAYVIVGGDSDFLSLVEKLKQYDKKVFIVGGRAFTSVILQRNCHEFIAYENLVGVRKPAARGERPLPAPASLPVQQAFPIIRRALKILADREVSPQTGLLKSTLLQLDSTFSERNYGASSFLDFVEKLAKAGLVQLKHAGRSVMVELNAGFDSDALSAAQPPAGDGAPEVQAAGDGAAPPEPRPAGPGGPGGSGNTDGRTAAGASEGVRLAGRLLATAGNARWPMYLRNVKHILRAGDPGFDERRYGFSGLMDLLRACQREGFVRLERDRRGGLHVFQGPSLQRAALPPEPIEPEVAEPGGDGAGAETDMSPVFEAAPDAVPGFAAAADDESAEPGPIPIDTTAELVGRARPKRSRQRVAAAAGDPSRGARKTTRRTSATRRSRTKAPADGSKVSD